MSYIFAFTGDQIMNHLSHGVVRVKQAEKEENGTHDPDKRKNIKNINRYTGIVKKGSVQKHKNIR